MIAFITGSVTQVKQDHVVINHNGMGYRIFMARPEVLKKNQDAFLYTYHHIREDAQLLYGFLEEQDYDLFCELIKVKGVGAKTAIGILSGCASKDTVAAIQNSDIAFMKKLPGIGPKSAQQIILDLRGKLVHEDETTSNKSFIEVEQALKSLGYKQSEITPIIKQLPSNDQGIDALIKQALGLMLKSKGG